MNRFSKILLLGVLTFYVGQTSAQLSTSQLLGQRNVITTAVPFLMITPDAASGAMGDVGVATNPDENCMHWNPAKLAFMPHDGGISVSYTPWLRSLVPDISLSYLSGYYKIDKLSGFGASLRYFSLGDIQFTDNYGNDLKQYRPYEFATDLGYARKLSDNFSIGVAGRFIYSDLAGKTPIGNGSSSTQPAIGFGGDISGYYTKAMKVSGYNANLGLGFDISNLGPKITYTNDASRDYIPINMRVGGYFNFHIDDYNELAIALDLNKLLVPTPPAYKLDQYGNPILDPVSGQPELSAGMDPNRPVLQGIFTSFYDAPGGLSEEIKEINPSVGLEYWYDKQVAGRMGYFYEAVQKGGRQYLTLGGGVRYNILTLDFSYLITTNGQNTTQRNPLDNTLRFTLALHFDKKKKSDKEPNNNGGGR